MSADFNVGDRAGIYVKGGSKMYSCNAKSFAKLREYIDKLPVIETHEHYTNYQKAEDAIDFIIGNYYMSDFMSAGGEAALTNGAIPRDLSERERYELFMKYYRKSDKTAYARGMMEGLRICWGVESIDTYEDFAKFAQAFKSRGASIYTDTMDRLLIKAKVVDIFDLTGYVDQKNDSYSKYCRFAFPLPSMHNLHSKHDVMKLQRYIGGRPIICLDDYLEAFDAYFQKCIDFGIVCIKDQSAYDRPINYGNPTKAEAEKAFNDIVFDPRGVFGDDRVRALDDWLFQYAMRKAAKYDIPVQIHTGHMAGIRNEIAKTNAAHLIPTIELHADVKFDLFHGNWPYMDEYLFIGKNYPNAWLNLCWAQSIDPLYCVEFMKRAVMTVPHNKIMAFGGDTGHIEWVAGYLSLARDNVAIALSELVDSGWLSFGEAGQIAADWFFNNPNELFKLEFDAITAV
ncbi:MAG: amidohydrolase family protein [Oscillospiraceae bacterium]|nr:amidohydrolase family protein [Oscillospiraceae bacterium]